MSNVLTTMECTSLAGCEDAIRRGLQSFVDVGIALAMIRDQRLYRTDYATFDDYCFDRWSMVASRARQLIAASEVYDHIQSVTMVTVLPTNESQVRPLVRLEPDAQVAAWEEAVSIGTPTRALVQEVCKPKAPKIPRLERLAAKHRILTTALALLEEDLGGNAVTARHAVYPDDAAEDAAYEVLEAVFLDRVAFRLIASLGV